MGVGIIAALFMGVVGLIWIIILDTFDESPRSDERQQGSASLESRDGEKAHNSKPCPRINSFPVKKALPSAYRSSSQEDTKEHAPWS
jgi:hypothetical protein